jgi:hypothetical protein
MRGVPSVIPLTRFQFRILCSNIQNWARPRPLTTMAFSSSGVKQKKIRCDGVDFLLDNEVYSYDSILAPARPRPSTPARKGRQFGLRYTSLS